MRTLSIICAVAFSVIHLSCMVNGASAGQIEKNLRITEVAVTSSVNPGRGDNIGPFWTFADLRATVLSPSANGESKVGWHDINGDIHITPLTSGDTRKAQDLVIGPGRLYDLVAHDDGFAILLMQNNRMYIDKYNDAGARLFRTELTDSDDRVDSWHAGKLVWNGFRYTAYFGIHGTAGFTEGHEGDKLKYIDGNGSIEPGGWEWGCSHSMDVRILYADSEAMPLCISDCYPGKGLYLKNNYLISAADGDCAGTTKARFGEMVVFTDYLALVYLSIDGRSNWDVIFNSFSKASPYGVRTERVVANTTANEINPKIIPYGSGRLLVSWETEGSTRTFSLVDIDGNFKTQAEQINVKAGPVDDFRSFPNGDVGWAYAWDSMNSLKVMRIVSRPASTIVPTLMLLTE